MQFLGPVWPSDLFFFVPNFQGGHRKFMFQSFKHRCPMVPFGRAFFKFHLLSLDHIVRSTTGSMNVAASFVACWTLFSPRSRAESGIADDRCQFIDAKLKSGEPKEWTAIFRLPTIDSSWLETRVEALNPSSLPLSSMAEQIGADDPEQ